MLGDAHHPPMPFGILGVGPTPPPFVTEPTLRPQDLGSDWHLQGPLKGGPAVAGQTTATPGLQSHALAALAQEKWNGQEWVNASAVLEIVQRFATSKEARTFVAQQVKDAKLSSSAAPSPGLVHRLAIGRVPVWRQDSVSASSPNTTYYTAVGSTAVRLDVIRLDPGSPNQPVIGPLPTFTPITDSQIVEAAIRRAKRAS
jgi:hypothetical protein